MPITRHGWLLYLCLSILLPLGCPAAKRGTLRKRQLGTSSPETEEPAPVASSSAHAPRGGHRQRRLRVEESDDDAPALHHSRLAANLKRRWGKGELSSTAVQDIAADAHHDGARGVASISSAGTSGKHAKNMFRDMLKLFGKPKGAPEIDWVEIPLVNGRKVPHPVIWPHKFFQALAKERIQFWNERICGSSNACKVFWESMRHTEFVKRHPYLPEASWPTVIPIGMHGDGGAFNKQDAVYSLSWNSLIASGTTVQTRFLFTVVKKTSMVPETLDVLLNMFSWSCNVLLSGETPHKNWNNVDIEGGGRPLANGYRGCLAQARGDWEWFTLVFGFPRWDAADIMCPFCAASNTVAARSWTDFGPNAGWRCTRCTHEAFMRSRLAAGLAVPALFNCIGFRLECIVADVLHCVDQGIGSHIIGNILWILIAIRAVHGGHNFAERVRLGNIHLKNWYKETKCKSRLQGPLTPERLRPTGDWPKLRAKAAQTRHMAAYALYMMGEFGQFHSVDDYTRLHDELALGVCQLLVRFYELLNNSSQHFGDVAINEFHNIGNQLTSMYSQLATMAFNRGQRFWKLSPKFHQFIEMCLYQVVSMGNPRYYWCYGDEDLVRILIGISESVHPNTLASSVLCKWL